MQRIRTIPPTVILELFPLSTSTIIQNGGDQLEDDRYKGSEEITPRPADDLYLGGQVTHVDNKKDSSKGHLYHRQGVP